MTHLHVPEWGRVAIGPDGFSLAQAEALLSAARAHPMGGEEGGAILTDHRHHLRAKQMVGVMAAPGCSLEILPKVDPEAELGDLPTVRSRLISLLDLALGLNLADGAQAAMAHGAENLLDILIRLFAQRLLALARRGLPRAYQARAEDLPTLRGKLNIVRQLTVHVGRPDRLACRFDVLSSDIPLMQVMKAAVVFLSRLARAHDTRRLLEELRFVLADVTDVPISALPWDQVRIDRTSQRWESVFALAKLLLRRDWQGTTYDHRSHNGIALLFPMNDLFEAAVAALLRRALSGSGISVVEQGGLRHCLGEWTKDEDCEGRVFQTRPDILLRRGGKDVAIIDTKWKCLSPDASIAKRGVAQGDVYQMMAYSRLYRCDRLMLLYPAMAGSGTTLSHRFGIAGGREMLAVGVVDLTAPMSFVHSELRKLIIDFLPTEVVGKQKLAIA
ncbi:calmodulin-binding protein [Sphingobium sp. 22B]|uniref:McrC family protein n=1 Tax=unclassified Sphingobium TaxID=2611147 RepID=UPI00078084C9|nr:MULTISPECIES: calmodulin-binding protein [unclassified Sphingobium]KXU30110.1 calmodulin-binding protein [Sphingobium sp. AM]KYC32366.1 calmodulin-binding protein [Sphingobium sp. 22B]OAP31996.1 calmodulin-binding protein [Sphingobium sp. 20006FA]